MENSNTLKDRLITYLHAKRESFAEFGRKVGVARSYVTSINGGISDDKKKIIREKYPDLNMDWLIFGEGEMLITPQERHFRSAPDCCCSCEEKDKEIAALKAQIQILKEMIREMNSDCGPQLRKA